MVKPYYDDGKGIQIFLGDCREILPMLPKVDLVLTDPPYNVGFRYEGSNDSKEPKSYLRWLRSIFRSSAKAGASHIVWFWQGIRVANGQVQACLPTGFYIHHCAAWFKREFAGDLWKGGHPAYSWEPIIWATNDEAPQFVGKKGGHEGRDGIIGNSSRHDVAAKGHPCPKTFSVVRSVLSWIPGTILLDPFMGSGTTLRAAKDLGRRAIGIEIEEKYCEIAARRLAQEVLPFPKEAA